MSLNRPSKWAQSSKASFFLHSENWVRTKTTCTCVIRGIIHVVTYIRWRTEKERSLPVVFPAFSFFSLHVGRLVHWPTSRSDSCLAFRLLLRSPNCCLQYNTLYCRLFFFSLSNWKGQKIPFRSILHHLLKLAEGIKGLSNRIVVRHVPIRRWKEHQSITLFVFPQ